MRFFPVPYEAHEIASDYAEQSAVADLYRRGHALRWGWFRITERSLSSRWGIGNRRVWSLLESLQAAGLVEIERGGSRKQTRIRVACPTDEEVSVQQGQQQGQQQHQQQDESGSPDETGEAAAQDAAQDAAQVAATSTRPETKAETEPENDHNDFAVAAALWKQLVPGGPRPKKGRGQGLALNGRIREEGIDAVLTVMRWASESGHSRARFLRERGMSLKTLMRPSNFEEYLTFARTAEPTKPINGHGRYVEPDGFMEEGRRLVEEARAEQERLEAEREAQA